MKRSYPYHRIEAGPTATTATATNTSSLVPFGFRSSSSNNNNNNNNASAPSALALQTRPPPVRPRFPQARPQARGTIAAPPPASGALTVARPRPVVRPSPPALPFPPRLPPQQQQQQQQALQLCAPSQEPRPPPSSSDVVTLSLVEEEEDDDAHRCGHDAKRLRMDTIAYGEEDAPATTTMMATATTTRGPSRAVASSPVPLPPSRESAEQMKLLLQQVPLMVNGVMRIDQIVRPDSCASSSGSEDQQPVTRLFPFPRMAGSADGSTGAPTTLPLSIFSQPELFGGHQHQHQRSTNSSSDPLEPHRKDLEAIGRALEFQVDHRGYLPAEQLGAVVAAGLPAIIDKVHDSALTCMEQVVGRMTERVGGLYADSGMVLDTPTLMGIADALVRPAWPRGGAGPSRARGSPCRRTPAARARPSRTNGRTDGDARRGNSTTDGRAPRSVATRRSTSASAPSGNSWPPTRRSAPSSSGRSGNSSWPISTRPAASG